jgi:hypothetical protein
VVLCSVLRPIASSPAPGDVWRVPAADSAMLGLASATSDDALGQNHLCRWRMHRSIGQAERLNDSERLFANATKTITSTGQAGCLGLGAASRLTDPRLA